MYIHIYMTHLHTYVLHAYMLGHICGIGSLHFNSDDLSVSSVMVIVAVINSYRSYISHVHT